jgi:hypothetical protein
MAMCTVLARGTCLQHLRVLACFADVTHGRRLDAVVCTGHTRLAHRLRGFLRVISRLTLVTVALSREIIIQTNLTFSTSRRFAK